MGEVNRQPPNAPDEKKKHQIFTNRDIHVLMEVLIKQQIFTNK